MNRLSALDAAFLYMETPETPMHVGSVTIFTPATPQRDLLERFRERTRARLDLLPSYRRRLKATPLGIDHPTWVIEDDVDLEYHIRASPWPSPGTMQQLRAVIEKLHAAAARSHEAAVGILSDRGSAERSLRHLRQGAP